MTATDALASAAPRHMKERLGAWAFRQRSWTPVPLALVLLVVRWNALRSPWIFLLGEAVVALGLAIRFWAVGQIGTVSRTRAARLGPLITTGPFAAVRNPLYVANFLIWIGFAIASGLIWMLPIAALVFAVQYGAIARFEEAALLAHFGARYAEYSRAVPRWIPRLSRLGRALSARVEHHWREVTFSERGTLIAALIMTLLLAARRRWLM